MLGYDELGLFEWYVRESAATFERMRAETMAYIEEQRDAVSDEFDIDDSGLVAIDYYLNRTRHGDLVYLTSLLESYLSRASEKLEWVIGTPNVKFHPRELRADKWERHKTFLERHGVSDFPPETWQTLRSLIKTRNKVVHEENECPVEEGDIVRYLAAFQDLVRHVTGEIDKSIEHRLQFQDGGRSARDDTHA